MGQQLTKRFSKSWIKKWNVICIDSRENPDAKHNFVVDLERGFGVEVLDELHSKIKSVTPEVDAMINLAQGPREKVDIGSLDVFERYETVKRHEMAGSLLLTHLASHFLSPNGFVGHDGG